MNSISDDMLLGNYLPILEVLASEAEIVLWVRDSLVAYLFILTFINFNCKLTLYNTILINNAFDCYVYNLLILLK